MKRTPQTKKIQGPKKKKNTRAIHGGNDGLQMESGHLQSHFVMLEHYTKNLRSSFSGHV